MDKCIICGRQVDEVIEGEYIKDLDKLNNICIKCKNKENPSPAEKLLLSIFTD